MRAVIGMRAVKKTQNCVFFVVGRVVGKVGNNFGIEWRFGVAPTKNKLPLPFL
jgi:hypothetical protein